MVVLFCRPPFGAKASIRSRRQHDLQLEVLTPRGVASLHYLRLESLLSEIYNRSSSPDRAAVLRDLHLEP